MSVSRGTAAVLLAASVAVATAGVVSAADQPGSRVTVVFVEPQRFTDIQASAARSEKGSQAILDEIERFMRATGEAQIPAGFTLDIRVTDIDLAGEFEPVRGPQFERTRFMRDVYWPRFDLGFVLRDAEGRVVKEERRTLRDLNYLTRSRLVSDDYLRYEKALLRDWLRQEFPR
jgi:hypothetical protein